MSAAGAMGDDRDVALGMVVPVLPVAAPSPRNFYQTLHRVANGQAHQHAGNIGGEPTTEGWMDFGTGRPGMPCQAAKQSMGLREVVVIHYYHSIGPAL